MIDSQRHPKRNCGLRFNQPNEWSVSRRIYFWIPPLLSGRYFFFSCNCRDNHQFAPCPIWLQRDHVNSWCYIIHPHPRIRGLSVWKMDCASVSNTYVRTSSKYSSASWKAFRASSAATSAAAAASSAAARACAKLNCYSTTMDCTAFDTLWHATKTNDH